ncbi:Drug/metabolite transporter [Macleaya cordata]|uniref:Probable purine permease n=1 Tax=Macleaya cordata TaxID=56857 RepID=A0A200QXS5_MACCD|nr:Drug/metabolite transporter [Macleaya cordata]
MNLVMKKRYLLLFNCILLAIGNTGGPLLLRLYFIHGGTRIWLSSWLETGGWPIMLLPLSISYLLHRFNNKGDENAANKFFTMTPPLFTASVVLGLLTGFDDYLYAYGVSLLPISTASLIISTHLAFTAGFALFIVKQKFTSYSVNSVVLLTIGAIVLGLHSSGDRPIGESDKQYYLGFFMTVAAAALNGFLLPMIELMYKKSKQAITYSLVIELQIVMCIFATLFCTVGMLVNKDFKAIPREGKEYKLGEAKYYTVLVASAIAWQLFFLGQIGVIFCATSLLSGVITAVLLPFTEILAVIFYHEKFKAEKGIALSLSFWGFISYFYGEFKESRNKKKQTSDSEQASSSLT